MCKIRLLVHYALKFERDIDKCSDKTIFKIVKNTFKKEFAVYKALRMHGTGRLLCRKFSSMFVYKCGPKISPRPLKLRGKNIVFDRQNYLPKKHLLFSSD